MPSLVIIGRCMAKKALFTRLLPSMITSLSISVNDSSFVLKKTPKCRWAIIHALSCDRWAACSYASVFH